MQSRKSKVWTKVNVLRKSNNVMEKKMLSYSNTGFRKFISDRHIISNLHDSVPGTFYQNIAAMWLTGNIHGLKRNH